MFSFTGYPPADVTVRDYLKAKTEDSDSKLQLRYCGFLKEMFLLAIEEINKLKRSGSLAKDWHDHLSKGQSAETVGSVRKEFYENVIRRTQESVLYIGYNFFKCSNITIRSINMKRRW
jgi:hypothetical protein